MPKPFMQHRSFRSIALSLISAAVFAVSMGLQSSSAGPNSAAAKAKLVKAGKALYTKNCQPCHAENGKGGKKAPKLQGITASDARITKMVTNGKPGQMPAFGEKLKPTDIKALIAYLRSLK